MRFEAGVIVLSLLSAHCASTAGPTDARTDGQVCTDAPPPSRSCNAANETPSNVYPGAPCDGMSRTQCLDWAIANAQCANAFAVCNSERPPADGGYDKCLRADHCDSAFSSHCFCGAEDACPAGAVCVADVPGAQPHCRCIGR